MRWFVPILLVAPACQLLEDATYKPRVGPPVPDAPPPPDSAAINGTCPVIPGDSCGDSDLAVAVSFSRDVQPLINRATPGGCMVHTQMQTMATVKFDPSTYVTLREGGVSSGAKIVIDCRPCDSILIQKLADPMPPSGGDRMPMDHYYWSDAEITLLRDWIAEGAQNN